MLIEDDLKVADYICKGIRENGHAAEHAGNGKDGLLMAMTGTYDVMIIDRMLPELDGLALIKTIRGAGNPTPVLILSALGQVDDKVKGLRSGGDDYLVKPFAFSELLARVEVLQRRVQHVAPGEPKISFGDLTVDLLSRKVMRAGKAVDLQPREYRLLEYMLKNRGKVVTRTMLLENVWDYHFDPQTNVIDVHISRLRNKLDKDNPKPLIKTIRGAGYMIDGTDEAL